MSLKIVGEIYLVGPSSMSYTIAEIEGDIHLSGEGDEPPMSSDDLPPLEVLEEEGAPPEPIAIVAELKRLMPDRQEIEEARTDVARYLFGREMIDNPPQLQPWSSIDVIRGYDPKRIYFVLKPGTEEIIGSIGRETKLPNWKDLTPSERTMAYSIATKEEEADR